MKQRVDLHTHTNFSDGAFSPKELITLAHKNNLDVISITDHDTISAISEAITHGEELGVEVIPGVELSSDIADREVHILGYFIDIENEELLRYLKFFRDERLKRAERIVKKLNYLGLSITLDDVLEEAKNSEIIGRPHIANAMLRLKLVDNFLEAFNKYLGNYAPAYEKKVHISPASAFKIISDAGGLAFIAHPGNMPENLIKELIDAGVDGIEIIHPSHTTFQTNYYKNITNQYFLLASGGSDFHGGKRNDLINFGKYAINYSLVENMRKRLLRSTA